MSAIAQHKWLEKIYEWLPWLPVMGLLMVISAIPYGWSVYQRIGSIVLVAGYVLYFVAYKQWRAVRWSNRNWMYVVMLLLYVLFPLRQLFDPTAPTEYYLEHLHRHEWFLYVGIAGILGFPKQLKGRYVAYVMLLTSVVMALHCAYLYGFTDEFSYCAPHERFDLLRRVHIHSHMVMNLYINAALLFGFMSLSESGSWKQKMRIGIAMCISWFLILISDGRVGIATSFIIVGVGMIYLLYRKNKLWGVAIASVLLFVTGLLVAQRPRLSVAGVSDDPRAQIWDYSIRMAKQKPIGGYGLSSLSEQYVEGAYEDSVMYHGFVQRIIESNALFREQGKTFETHHPHNAFLTYWLAVGIGGVLLLIALFVSAACLPVGENRIFLWLFLLALFLQCMTEPIGAHLMPQFIALMLFVWDKITPEVPCDRS